MPLSRLRRSTILAGLLTLLAALLLAPAARAHDVLVATDPEDAADLESAPSAITLSFNNSPLDVGSSIVVADSEGETVVEGPGTVTGTDVVLELDTELAAGDYEVQWRVASSDGHPIEGTFGFAVEGASAPVETAEPVDPATPAGSAATVQAEEEAADEVVAGAPEPTEEEGSGGLSSLPLWLRVALALAALASVAGLIVIAARRLGGDRL